MCCNNKLQIFSNKNISFAFLWIPNIYIYIYIYKLADRSRGRPEGSLVMSYQWLLKWYLIPPCLTLSNIWCVSRVKSSKPGKGVAASPTPRCSSYWKGSLLVALDNSRQLFFLLQWGVGEDTTSFSRYSTYPWSILYNADS